MDAEAVVSSDKKAFDNLQTMRRWELSKTAQVVQTFESGTLTLFIAGVGLEASSRLLLQTMTFLLRGIVEVMQIIVSLTGILAGRTLEAISSLPKWAWALILGALASVLVLALVNEDFQEEVKETVSKALNAIWTMFSTLLEAVEYLWRGIKEITIIVWNIAAPAILPELIVIFGVALETIVGLMQQARGNFETFNSAFSSLRQSPPAEGSQPGH
jgi:hypothetical protein